MTKNFEELKRLERMKIVVVKVNDSHAIEYFFKKSKIGKVSSWFSKLMPTFILALVFGLHGYTFLIVLLFIVVYAFTLKMGSQIYTRKEILKDENLFNKEYEAKFVRILYKSTKKSIKYPEGLLDLKKKL